MTHANPPLRRLGRSGLAVSTVGLGCNNLGRPHTPTADLDGTRALIDAALGAGVTLFDTADVYGARPGLSEELLGQALGRRREDVVVATKFGMSLNGSQGADFGARGSRRYLVRAAEASLRRLGTDWIDLYQFHTPDPATPIEETLAALDDLIRAGKIRYVGHSNRAGWQIAEAEFVARSLGSARFVSAQNQYNLIDRGAELEVLPAADAYGIGVLPYFPLANGLLTGKYTRGERPADARLVHSKPALLDAAPWEALASLRAFCEVREITELQVAFGWLLSHRQVSSVIAGATRPEQIRANAASGSWIPTAADLTELDAIFPPPTKVAPF